MRLWPHPSSRLCQPQASDSPQSPPWTTGTASLSVRSTALVLSRAARDEPIGVPPPPAADDTRHNLRFSATPAPAEAALPEGADSPFGPYPLPLTHTALAADTLHTPQRRIESLSSCAGVRFCPSDSLSCTPCWLYAPPGRRRSQTRGLSRSPPWEST